MRPTPILFNQAMVCALMHGTKSVTRRVIKRAGNEWDFIGIEERPYKRQVANDGTEYPKELDWPHAVFSAGNGYYDCPMIKLPCRTNDILYVRETWGDYSEHQPGGAGYYLYRADYPDNAKTYDFDGHVCDLPRWHPSIHMPREAARIFLRVTDVRVEHIQSMTMPDIRAEGVVPYDVKGGTWQQWQQDYMKPVWDSTIKPADHALYSWAANPWVWVIEFERISKEAAYA